MENTKTFGQLAFTTAAVTLLAILLNPVASPAAASTANICVECHQKINPSIVADWRISRHSEVEVGCADCHGNGHKSGCFFFAANPLF